MILMRSTGLTLELARCFSYFLCGNEISLRSIGYSDILSLPQWPFLFGLFEKYMLSRRKGKTRRRYQV